MPALELPPDQWVAHINFCISKEGKFSGVLYICVVVETMVQMNYVTTKLTPSQGVVRQGVWYARRGQMLAEIVSVTPSNDAELRLAKNLARAKSLRDQRFPSVASKTARAALSFTSSFL